MWLQVICNSITELIPVYLVFGTWWSFFTAKLVRWSAVWIDRHLRITGIFVVKYWFALLIHWLNGIFATNLDTFSIFIWFSTLVSWCWCWFFCLSYVWLFLQRYTNRSTFHIIIIWICQRLIRLFSIVIFLLIQPLIIVLLWLLQHWHHITVFLLFFFVICNDSLTG